MVRHRVQLSHLEYFSVWALRITFCLWPPVLAGATRQRSATAWIMAAAGVAVCHLLFLYVQRRCSSERLSFWNGLLVVAHSMRTGWISMSAALALPALLVTFFASLIWSCLGDLRGDREYAPRRFEALVKGLYRVRMREEA